MVRLKVSDSEGRYKDPFLGWLVMSDLDSFVRGDLGEWGAKVIDREDTEDNCCYLEFETGEQATAFTLRWSFSYLEEF